MKFIKGLIMALISAVVALLSQDPIVWEVVIITIIGTALVYTGKNAWYGSTSPEGQLNLRDIMSSLLILVGTAVVSGATTFIINGAIDWLLMLKTALGVVFTYLGTTVFAGEPKK